MARKTLSVQQDITDLVGTIPDARLDSSRTDIVAADDPDGLTPRERAFINAFAARPNGPAAVLAAGYGDKMLRVTADNLLRKTKVANALRKRRAEVANETWISAVDVVREFTNMAFSDSRALFDANGTPIPLHEMDPEIAAMVKKFEVQETEVNGAITQRTYKYEVVDRMKALDALAKHLGLFVEKVEVTGKDGGAIQVEQTPNEKARRVAFLLASAMEAKRLGGIEDAKVIDNDSSQ